MGDLGMSDELRYRIHRICYQRILPHIAKCREEPDIEKSLPLLEPRIFAQFAYQACTDTAAFLTKQARRQYRHYASSSASRLVELRSLAVNGDDEEELRKTMLAAIGGFNDALDRYSSVYERFRQLVGQAHQAAWRNGIAVGNWAGELFEGLAAIMVGAVGGYVAGSSIDRTMQAETERLEQEYHVMLQGYDQAMDILIANGVQLLAYHRKELIAATRDSH
jgi:outer membrane lipoprotein SlyB